MTRDTFIKLTLWSRWQTVLRAPGLVLLAGSLLGQVSSVEAKSRFLQVNYSAAVLAPALQARREAKAARFQPTPERGYPVQRNKLPVWLASNVDSNYLAGVREGRFASLEVIKSAIQAFTGVSVKRVLSIAMQQGVLSLTVEDVYSNIFTINVQPESAQILQ